MCTTVYVYPTEVRNDYYDHHSRKCMIESRTWFMNKYTLQNQQQKPKRMATAAYVPMIRIDINVLNGINIGGMSVSVCFNK